MATTSHSRTRYLRESGHGVREQFEVTRVSSATATPPRAVPALHKDLEDFSEDVNVDPDFWDQIQR